MVKYGGYAGRLLRVNLTTGEIATQELSDDFCRLYMGGDGFAARILYDEVPAGVDAFDPENRFIVMTGPVEGTLVPGAGRTVVVTKSPLTNGYVDSYFGGHFGTELKFAGYDGIVIYGKAPKPVYLFIDDDQVEIRDAGSYWGMHTFPAQVKLREELGDTNIATMVIGPAGEKLSRIACTISGARAAGRGGTGAVMGSKNLKLIAVRGSKDVKVPDMAKLREFIQKTVEAIKANPGTGQALPTYGTTGGIAVNNKLGMLGTRNWQTEVFEGADKISATAMREEVYVKDDACAACPIYCGKVTVAKKGQYKGALTVGPEYETLWSLGSNLGNDNLESIVAADRLCDELGLDTISAGACISFAMECYEKGLLTDADTGGMQIRFGDHEVMMRLLEMMANREGIGDLLTEGTMRAAERIGKDAYKYAIHVKGMEVPAHSGRGVPGMGIGYATSVRGGTHQDGRPTAERTGVVDINKIEGKGYYEVDIQRMTTISDSFIVCRMTEGIYGLLGITDEHARLVQAVTGMEVTKEELIDIADRIYALQRAFNIRHRGACREKDVLPWRFMNEPIPEGPAKGKYMPREVLDKLLDETYEKRGWDKETGYPTKETLERLGLHEVAVELYGGK